MTTATMREQREYVHNGKRSKVDRYGWILRDRPGVFMLINKHELNIDGEYQRKKIAVGKVREIASSWAWAGCGCILVAMRSDGSFWVFDGQHRVLAALSRADIAELPCLVFECDEKTQEAAGFLVANTQRKPVPAIDKFNALVMTNDARALTVDMVFKRLGLTISDNARSRKEIKCVTNCLKHAADPESFELALRAAMSLQDDESVHRYMLDGLMWIQRKYRLLEDPKFLRRFASISRKDILASMQKFAGAHDTKSDKVCGMAIMQCVNKGLHKKFGDADE